MDEQAAPSKKLGLEHSAFQQTFQSIAFYVCMGSTTLEQVATVHHHRVPGPSVSGQAANHNSHVAMLTDSLQTLTNRLIADDMLSYKLISIQSPG